MSVFSVFSRPKDNSFSKEMAAFLLKNYPQTRHELFYSVTPDYKKAEPMVVQYYFKILAKKAPEKTYNILTQKGLEEFKKREGISPVWFLKCVNNDGTFKKLLAVYGDSCAAVPAADSPRGANDSYIF